MKLKLKRSGTIALGIFLTSTTLTSCNFFLVMCSSGNWGVVEEVHSPQICSELPEGPFCIVYMRSTVQKEKKIPCITILRWLYEEVPSGYKDRLQESVLHPHPPPASLKTCLCYPWLVLLDWRLVLENQVCKPPLVSLDNIKRGEIEILNSCRSRDDVLQRRPLTDYGTELDPFHLNEIPVTAYSLGRYEDRWASREYFSFYTWEADHIQALAELESQEGWND